MRDLFRGYYTPTPEDLDRIWEKGLFVLDTNALLNLFRYTETTRTEFLTVLTAVAEKLWIPNQIGLEFQRRRLDVIEDQIKAYDDLDKAIEAGRNSVNKALQAFRHHPSLDKLVITGILDVSMKQVSEAVGQSRGEYNARVVAGSENELVFDAISDLYTSRVGPPLDQATLDALYVEGAIRYEAKMPPGYEDKTKPEPERYGDLVLWRQLLAHVSTEPRPALFITDDGKEDWWRRAKGKTQGPRVELVDEFFEASGQRVHFYAPERFLDFAKQKLGITVSDNSLSEVEEVSRERPLRDVNALLAERAQLQSQRNEIEKNLMFPASSTHDSASKLGQLVDRLEALSLRKSELGTQAQVVRATLEGLEEGGVRSSIIAHSSRLDSDLSLVEAELEDTYARFDRYSRNQRAHNGSAVQHVEHELELRSILRRIEQIDDKIDNRP